MEIKLKSKPFGQIISISGMSVIIEVSSDPQMVDQTKLIQEEVIGGNTHKFHVGNVGGIFMIGGPSTSDDIHYAMFEEVKLITQFEAEANQPIGALNEKRKAIVSAKVIGYQDRAVKDKLRFSRGIGQYPRFNSKCFLLTSEEKADLFVISEGNGIEIGSVPASQPAERIAINTDKFLGKHSVVLGSTGSGKSCTVASIVQKILVQHPFSHCIFFDFHDEYSRAFPEILTEERPEGAVFIVNKHEADSFDLPYWLLNFEEFMLTLLQEIDQTSNNDGIRIVKETILELKAESHLALASKGILGGIKKISINSPLYFSFDELLKRLRNLNKKTKWKDNTPALVVDLDESIESNKYFIENPMIDGDVTIEFVPATTSLTYFRKGQDQKKADKAEPANQVAPYYGSLTTIIDRFEAIRNDKRYDFLFRQTKLNSTQFYEFAIDLLCIPRLIEDSNTTNQSQLTIFNLSKIPSEIAPTVVGVLARICFEYKTWEADPHLLPLFLVFEEAHNYIPHEPATATRLPLKYISRIAKEGRKYGISQLIVSQRPSDLSQLVVSQCSNFFILRVTNPNDQAFINHVLPDHLSALSNMIPFFQNGECLIAGECVTLPQKAIIDEPNPFPRSDDVEFSKRWKMILENYSEKDTIHRWWDIETEKPC